MTFLAQDIMDNLRSDFPILSRSVHNKPLVYLDSAASSQKPHMVIDAMSDFMKTSYANVHRGVHALATESTDAYEQARELVAGFVGADINEIVFTGGATDAINMVAYSFLAPQIKPGDEIIVSQIEHHANLIPWHFLRERHGAVLRFVPLNEEFGLDMEAFEALVNDRTVMIALTHRSNVTGARTDVERVVAMAKPRSIPVLLDGCQGAVHERIDVKKMGVDFYAFTAHKLYGPTGIGALWGKPDFLAAMQPFRGGGEMIDLVSEDHITYATSPRHLEAGTPAITEAVGFGAAISYMQQFDLAKLHAHEAALTQWSIQLMEERPWLQHYTNKDSSGVISFGMDGVHPHDLATFLDHRGVAVRAGHHCAQPLMTCLGESATTRASFGIYTSQQDVASLFEALDAAQSFFSRFR